MESSRSRVYDGRAYPIDGIANNRELIAPSVLGWRSSDGRLQGDDVVEG